MCVKRIAPDLIDQERRRHALHAECLRARCRFGSKSTVIRCGCAGEKRVGALGVARRG